MKPSAILITLTLAFASVNAKESDAVKKLSDRIDVLEKRVAELEAKLETAEKNKKLTRDELVSKARGRMRKDADVYTKDELRDIETQYQIANKKFGTKEARDALKKLVTTYKKANRTGCALLYLGQMSKGEDRKKYFKQAIDGFSDCCYGNGVQVGAYARWYLAHYYKGIGKKDDAKRLFDEIKTLYPSAINHRGRYLVDQM